MSTSAPGKVWIVGAGPGDPELLTLRAARLVEAADDLVVDALVPPEVYSSSAARVVHVGKRAGRPSISQREIERILVALAREGRRVVRLKGGDPSLFGRLAEEVRALQAAGIPHEVVPGVTSVVAAPLTAGIPLTDREAAHRVVVMTGQRREGAAAPLSLPLYDEEQTLVLVMALRHLPRLVAAALSRGYPRDLPAVAVSRATLVTQRWVADGLARLPASVTAAGIETPATVIVGRVAAPALAGLSAADGRVLGSG